MNPKDRAGARKPSLTSLPLTAVFEASIATHLGATKYGPHNWRDIPVAASAYVAAAMRHLAQWWEGQDDDDESTVSHLAHAIASLAVLRDAQVCGTMQDDRPARHAPAGWLDDLTRKLARCRELAAKRATGSPTGHQSDASSSHGTPEIPQPR